MRFTYHTPGSRSARFLLVCSAVILLVIAISGCATTVVVAIPQAPQPRQFRRSPRHRNHHALNSSLAPHLLLREWRAGPSIACWNLHQRRNGERRRHRPVHRRVVSLCFQGNEANIDGGQLTPSATPQSTIGYLVHNGWTLNNLFPDPANFAYLDYCSNAYICVNSLGSGAPFTFVGFDQYASHTGGYTTFQLHVATIAAPTCVNDPAVLFGNPEIHHL